MALVLCFGLVSLFADMIYADGAVCRVRLARAGPWLGLLLAGVVFGLAYDQSITLVLWLILGINALALAVLGWVPARS